MNWSKLNDYLYDAVDIVAMLTGICLMIMIIRLGYACLHGDLTVCH